MQNNFLTPYKEDSGVPSYLPFPRFLVPLDLSNDARFCMPCSLIGQVFQEKTDT